jgi:hypothetical protein
VLEVLSSIFVRLGSWLVGSILLVGQWNGEFEIWLVYLNLVGWLIWSVGFG